MGFYHIVNEVYFGRNPEVEAVFQQFCKFRNKHISNSVFRYDPKINMDPEVVKFNRMMEDLFGFADYEFIINNENVVNAYTFSIGGSIDNKKETKRCII